MKKIVLGNDFNLIIPVSRKVHTSTGDVIQDFNLLPACTDLQVNLVNFNETISLPCSVDVEHTSRLIANVDSSKLNIGNYALEVKGKIYGNAWRSNEYEQIAFVNNNASADEVFDGEIIEGESSVEVDHVFIIFPPTAGFTEIIDQASNVDINLNDANLEITRRTGEKKSFDLNTVNVEIGEGIKNIRRLTGSTPKDLKKSSWYVVPQGDFLQFLLSQGNYVGIQISYTLNERSYYGTLTYNPLLYLNIPYNSEYDSDTLGLCLSMVKRKLHLQIVTKYYNPSQSKVLLDMEMNGTLVDGQKYDIDIILFPPCILNNDLPGKIPSPVQVYFGVKHLNSIINESYSDSIDLPKILHFYNNVYSRVTLVPYEGNNRYVYERNDGILLPINTTDNLVIGSDHIDRWGALSSDHFDTINRTFFKKGSFRINGSGSFKDLVAKTLNVKGSTKLEGPLEVGQSITTHSTLKAGETTLEGTLHVEESDIKTKSVYPAKTGGSYLKDPSNGHVHGNYVVNKSSLGKGAHNYDKLFVENLFWSDCTDPSDYSTSLNGKGTIPIFRREGLKGYPTFYVYGDTSTYRDGYEGVGLYWNPDLRRFVIESSRASSDEGYDTDFQFNFNYDGTIQSGHLDNTDFIFGNGVKYNKDNKIPVQFIELFSRAVTQTGKVSYNLGFVSENPLTTIYLATVGDESPTIFLQGSGSNLYLGSNIDETYSVGLQNHINSPAILYATDGSYFDTKKLVVKETVDFIADATTAEDVVTKFNQLLANLRSAGIMKSK